MATHPDLSRGWEIMHQSPLGSICHPGRIFSRINWRGSSLPSASKPFSSIPSSLASKLRVSYWGGNCLEEGNGEEMFEQAEVEGFFQSGYKLGVGITLYQELPHLQELDARLLCPAVVKELINRDSPGWDWGGSACPT